MSRITSKNCSTARLHNVQNLKELKNKKITNDLLKLRAPDSDASVSESSESEYGSECDVSTESISDNELLSVTEFEQREAIAKEKLKSVFKPFEGMDVYDYIEPWLCSVFTGGDGVSTMYEMAPEPNVLSLMGFKKYAMIVFSKERRDQFVTDSKGAVQAIVDAFPDYVVTATCPEYLSNWRIVISRDVFAIGENLDSRRNEDDDNVSIESISEWSDPDAEIESEIEDDYKLDKDDYIEHVERVAETLEPVFKSYGLTNCVIVYIKRWLESMRCSKYKRIDLTSDHSNYVCLGSTGDDDVIGSIEFHKSRKNEFLDDNDMPKKCISEAFPNYTLDIRPSTYSKNVLTISINQKQKIDSDSKVTLDNSGQV